MYDFDYEAPTSLAEAVRILANANGTARPLAGGTDLIHHLRIGRRTAETVVDVKKIPELNVLEQSADGLRLGAAVPCYRICGDERIRTHYSALHDAAHLIGGIQIQNRASMGGNLCNSGPAGDSIPAMIALGGVCTIAGPGGTREVAVEEFCTAKEQNVLQPGELLVDVRFPSRSPQGGSHYRRFIPRNEMDIAVVGVGASVVLDESGESFVSARIGLGAVAPTPLLAQAAGDLLAGQPANGESIAKAAEAARAIADPIDDMRGTREFRLHVVGVLTKRVLAAAVERARGTDGE